MLFSSTAMRFITMSVSYTTSLRCSCDLSLNIPFTTLDTRGSFPKVVPFCSGAVADIAYHEAATTPWVAPFSSWKKTRNCSSQSKLMPSVSHCLNIQSLLHFLSAVL